MSNGMLGMPDNNFLKIPVSDEIYQKAVDSLTERAMKALPNDLDSERAAMLKFKISEGMLEAAKTVVTSIADDLREQAWSEGWGAGMTGETENPYTK